ncbi:FG-GAP-like repeat-containing protein [Nocardioides yefusunii]|uniref:FG-GAP-like repeat-containing protein n=1 Tax=Nocardioides yefusunii TaxID=2500546 RepID=A0ABW1R033_9ACTN|nr:FG-GAP-like repeat-containing protein [Nocardioides yefusunii]
MSIIKNRLSTACQRTLTVVAAVALIAPAATVIELDVVTSGPDAPSSSATAGAVLSAAVPVESVEPQVNDYAIEIGEQADALAAESLPVEAHADHDHGDHADETDAHAGHSHGLPSDVAPDEVVTAAVSAPVEGYGAVGVTWGGDAVVSDAEIALQVRTRVGEEWSDWDALAYHDEHAPDPESAEGQGIRAGTEATVVGNVDEVEVRVDGVGALPEDLTLSVVDPGAVETRTEAPAIDTADSAAAPVAVPAAESIALSSGSVASDVPLVAAAAVTAPKPLIYSRAQWGADESIRDKSSLHYGKVQAGFVHHTVNANDYTSAEVPGIIRSIYAYHVKSKGWSDIGYNFLVDRFGRIWEGRYGGVEKAVVGAHTVNRNSNSFAGSAIGNFETVQPTSAMIDAYASLFAWKLGLNGVAADAKNIKINGATFQAISGHRDSAATACPGQHLYAKIGDIRKKAKALQGTTGSTNTPQTPAPTTPAPTTPAVPQFADPVIQSNLIGTAHPDILVRRTSDKKLFAIPTGGLSELAAPTTLYKSMATTTRVFTTPDMNGDGKADLVSISGKGATTVRYGNGKGKFTAGKSTHAGTAGYSLLVAAGDINRDGRADLVGRDAKGQGIAFLRNKHNKFARVKLNRTFKTVSALYPVGDVTGDGYPDLLARRKKDKALVIIRSTGSRSYAPAKKLAGDWSKLRDIVGGVDFDKDGKTDIVFRNTDGNVWVLPGLGNGTFESAALGPIAKNTAVSALSTAPLNGTSNPDVLGRVGKSVVVLKNTGKFELGTPVSLKISMPTATAIVNAGDFNKDGKGDVMAVRENGQLILRTGDGTGGLSKAIVIGSGFTGVTNIQAVGDVTRDGHPDLMGTQGGVTKIWPGQGTAKLKAAIAAPNFKAPLARLKTASAYDPTQYDWKLTVSDLRLGAGTTDLVVRERTTGRLHVFENTAKGIGSRRYLGRGLGVYDLAG